LAPLCALLPSLPPEATGVDAVVVDVVVVLGALLLVLVEAAAAVALLVVLLLVLVLDAFEPPATNPSWLSAEKMLSMNPIMPPPRSPPPSSS
jgi:hypothetical protein